MYNTKNYALDGELHIGGKLIIEPDAEVDGLRAPNVEALTSSTTAACKDKINEILSALKNGGSMEPDTWDISTKAVPGGTAQMPTPETIANSAHATVTYEDGVITIALDCEVADLEDADHGATWGVHKWLGFGIDTGLDSIVGVTYNDTELTQADATEASDLGLSAGDFVLYIKAEDPAYLTDDKTFVLGADAHKPITVAIKITETKD